MDATPTEAPQDPEAEDLKQKIAEGRQCAQEEYWVNCEGEELAEEVMRRVEHWYSELPRNIIHQRWITGWKDYCGLPTNTNQADVSQMVFSGREAENVKLKIPHLSHLARTAVQTVTANRPEMTPVPINDDYASEAELAAAKATLSEAFEEAHLEKKFEYATEIAVACGQSWVSATWDNNAGPVIDFKPSGEEIHAGEFESKVYMPWDVVTDLHRQDAHHEWIITVDRANKFDLAYTYPTVADEILELEDNIHDSVRGLEKEDSAPESDFITTYTLYHVPTPACPNGRWAIVVDSELMLSEGPLPYKKLPLVRHTGGEILNTQWGDSPVCHGLAIQEALNELASAVLSNNINLMGTNVMGFKGIDISRSELATGMNYFEADPIPGTQTLPVPQSFNLAKSSPETLELVSMLGNTLGTITGINNAASGADPELNKNLSGSALLMLVQQTIKFLSSLQASYTNLVEQIGTRLIDILKVYAKKTKLQEIVGKGKEFELDAFKELDTFDRIKVQLGSANMNSPAVNLQLAQDLANKGLVNAKQYMQVFFTGKLDAGTDFEETEILNMKRENEELLDGQTPNAIKTDDHMFHIKQHKGLLDSPGARNDPGLIQRVCAHIDEHFQLYNDPANQALLQALGYKAAPVAPPGVPPPQGPGNPAPLLQQHAAPQAKPPLPPKNPGSGQRAPQAPGASPSPA